MWYQLCIVYGCGCVSIQDTALIGVGIVIGIGISIGILIAVENQYKRGR